MNRIEAISTSKRVMLLGAVILITTLLLALVAEAVVRVRHYAKFGNFWGIESTYVVDAKSGLRIPIPNSELGAIRINSRGFRSPEIAVPKPPGTVRIAFLGASTTYCAEVSSNALTWPHQVSAALQRHWPDVTIDYVNAGVPGYGVSASLRNLEYRVKDLEPDVIVIYHATNDLSSNSYDLAVRAGVAQKRTEQSLTWPSQYSLLWYLAEKNIKVWNQKQKAHSTQDKLVFEVDELSAPFRRDLSALVNASKSIAEQVVLITFAPHLRAGQPPEQQARAVETSLYYMPYMSVDGLLKAFAAYNQVIREVAAESGALLIEGERAVPGDPVHFRDSVHFTDAGSTTMATYVARAMTESSEIGNLILRARAASSTSHTPYTAQQWGGP